MTADSKAVPLGWCIAALGSLGRYLNGRGFKSSEWSDRGRPIVRIQNLTGSSNGFNYFDGDVRPGHEVEPGDLLVSWAATLGAYRWRGPKAVLNQHIFKVESFIDSQFHFYALRWTLAELQRSAHGSGMVHVTKSEFDRTQVPLPPAKEQRRIVSAIESYFTRLDDAVATLERVQRNLMRYRASVLKSAVEGRLVPTEAELARTEGRSYEPASVLLTRVLAERRRRWEEAELAKMTAKGKAPKDDKWKAKYVEPVAPDTSALPALPEGWCWATWDRLSERVTVGHVGKMKDQYVSSGVPFLRGGNVRANRYEPTDLKFVSREFHEELAKSILAPGDVLIVRSGAVGTSCVVPSTLEEANCSDLVIVKQPFGIEARFGAYYMNSLAQATVRSQQVGVALIHFNTKSAAALPVPVPPTREQDRVVDAAEKALSVIDELEAEVVLNLRRLSRLRQSILKWAFEGRLVDQDPSDEPASVLLERIRAERASASETPPRRASRSNERAPKS